MPLPTPEPGQMKDDFLSACMGDKTMNKDFPDNPQRYAVCLAQWDKAKEKRAQPDIGSGWPSTPF